MEAHHSRAYKYDNDDDDNNNGNDLDDKDNRNNNKYLNLLTNEHLYRLTHCLYYRLFIPCQTSIIREKYEIFVNTTPTRFFYKRLPISIITTISYTCVTDT
jgi:hypothetical protein